MVSYPLSFSFEHTLNIVYQMHSSSVDLRIIKIYNKYHIKACSYILACQLRNYIHGVIA